MNHLSNHMYTPTEIQLAHEMAEKLKDPEALSLYLSYTKKYSHKHLRELLNKVGSIPDHKIKRSRGALFTYLVGQHGQYRDEDSGY